MRKRTKEPKKAASRPLLCPPLTREEAIRRLGKLKEVWKVSDESTLIDELVREFTTIFQDCIVLRDVDSYHRTRNGQKFRDPANVIYVDVPLSVDEDRQSLTEYLNTLRERAVEILEDDSITVTAHPVYSAAF